MRRGRYERDWKKGAEGSRTARKAEIYSSRARFRRGLCSARKGKRGFALGAIFEVVGPGSPRRGQSRGDVHDLCRPGKGCKRRVKRYKEKRMAPTRYANTNAADTGWVVLFRSTYSPFSPLRGPHLSPFNVHTNTTNFIDRAIRTILIHDNGTPSDRKRFASVIEYVVAENNVY